LRIELVKFIILKLASEFNRDIMNKDLNSAKKKLKIICIAC